MEKTETINKFSDLEREKIVRLAAETLWEPKHAEILSYLYKRGLTDAVMRQFNFGYCPAGVNHMLAGRIIMPLYNSHGQLIAITSRNPFCAKQFQHWHESFDKGDFLYGLNVARREIFRTRKAIVVEGQFDTTCLHSHGFGQTIGVLGSAFGIAHISLLARMCTDIFIVLDPDKSGEAGVERALDLVKLYELDSYQIRLVPVRIPFKKDPDEFVLQDGPDAFVSLLRKSKEEIINGRFRL